MSEEDGRKRLPLLWLTLGMASLGVSWVGHLRVCYSHGGSRTVRNRPYPVLKCSLKCSIKYFRTRRTAPKKKRKVLKDDQSGESRTLSHSHLTESKA